MQKLTPKQSIVSVVIDSEFSELRSSVDVNKSAISWQDFKIARFGFSVGTIVVVGAGVVVSTVNVDVGAGVVVGGAFESMQTIPLPSFVQE